MAIVVLAHIVGCVISSAASDITSIFYVYVWIICDLREKYQELLSNFNKLQCEKASLLQLVESGSVDAETTEAELKVWVIQ